MKSILVVITIGKEAFPRVNSLFHMTQVLAQQKDTKVELLLLGPGVELLRANQKSSPIFSEMFSHLRQIGVDIAACEVSLEAFGVPVGQMLPARLVKGAVEINQRIDQGVRVLTF
ncbi:sulfur reductase DrsE [Methylacidiphilum sp. Yel]|jgi:hypothetical protein|uniref:DsrE family protein n=1 Tax=Methylacidiphilum sp. Yel TaxID=1847730 RepID=UPI00106B1A7D|nr:DsrE family protein [Methylacidiphilum sp. Yel]TFE68485.1 sulfur reductase DrsE [Methylacidiphilum sp. Yel]